MVSREGDAVLRIKDSTGYSIISNAGIAHSVLSDIVQMLPKQPQRLVVLAQWFGFCRIGVLCTLRAGS